MLTRTLTFGKMMFELPGLQQHEDPVVVGLEHRQVTEFNLRSLSLFLFRSSKDLELQLLLLLWMLLYCFWLLPRMDVKELPHLLLNL